MSESVTPHIAEEEQLPTHLVTMGGAMAGLILAFATQQAFDLEDSRQVFALFLALGSAGWVAGWFRAMALRKRFASSVPAPAPVLSTGDFESIESDRRGGSETMRFVAVAGLRESSAALVPHTVPQLPVPLGPPPLAIRLLQVACDQAIRVPAIEGVLTRLVFSELLERVRTELRERCPRTPHEPRFHLTWWSSEGPLTEEGACAHGWTFRFADHRLGLGCLVLVTRQEMQLIYHSMATSWLAEGEPSSDPLQALQLAYRLAPALEGRSLRICGAPPSEVWVLDHTTRRLVELDPAQEILRNPSVLEGIEEAQGRRAIALDDVLAFLRGEDPPPTTSPAASRAREVFAATLLDADYLSDLRTFRDGALKSTSRRLMRYHGPAFGEELLSRVESCGEPAERIALTHLVGWLPTPLALAWLQRLAVSTSDPDVKVLAETLGRKRRPFWLEERHELFFGHELLVSRRRMGKSQHRVVPLKSVYDLEEGLLQPLVRTGLRVTRRRYLSGTAELVLGAGLRSVRGDTEAILVSMPVPLPCHVLHLVGSGADTFAQRIEREELVYTDEEIEKDALSRNPTAVHRAALMCHALRRPFPGGLAALKEAMVRGGQDRNLARALLGAAAVLPGPEAEKWVEDAVEAEENEERKQYLTRLLQERTTHRLAEAVVTHREQASHASP